MKTTQRIAAAVMAALSTGLAAEAAIVVPGANGSDGALLINQNTVIDLSQAATGQWDNDNSSNAGKGVYDPEKWAVVFKFSSVTITGGATVTFKNHPSRAPVVWLVSNDVVIDPGSVVNLSGQNSVNARLAEPGPGGFRGGSDSQGYGSNAGPGFGPGGGAAGGYGVSWPGSAAGHALPGGFSQLLPTTYGNPSLIPLVGGSGGGGPADHQGSGGAGGGAILIASQQSISVNGAVLATGGVGRNYDWGRGPGSGSGGSVRLVSDVVNGSGAVNAMGGYIAPSDVSNIGSPGRIRIERVVTDDMLAFAPESPSVVPLQSGDTAQIWMPANGPSVRIVSIGGVPAPADPRANFGGAGADVSLPQTATVTVVLEATNVEDASKIFVRLMPRANGQVVQVEATLQEVVSTSPRVSRWVVEIPVGGGYAALQARVVRP